MAAETLREKLTALVGEWRREAGYENVDRAEAAVFKSCSRELAAILEEPAKPEEPKLPLGHEFYKATYSSLCQAPTYGWHRCDQPREAHERAATHWQAESHLLRARVKELEEHRAELIATLDSRTQGWRERAEKAEADLVRVRTERAAALSVKTKEGLSASEWLLRTGLAEERADKLQADLDAALDWIADEAPPPTADFDVDQRVLALLAQRKEAKR